MADARLLVTESSETLLCYCHSLLNKPVVTFACLCWQFSVCFFAVDFFSCWIYYSLFHFFKLLLFYYFYFIIYYYYFIIFILLFFIIFIFLLLFISFILLDYYSFYFFYLFIFIFFQHFKNYS